MRDEYQCLSESNTHSQEVLDTDHPGIRAAEEREPHGWKCTLQYLQSVVFKHMEDCLNRGRPHSLLFRGEGEEFSVMETSLHRWARKNPTSANRPFLGEDVRLRVKGLGVLQTAVLFMAAARGPDSLVHPGDVLERDAFAIFSQMLRGESTEQILEQFMKRPPLLASNPAVRRMLAQLQHQGGPTNLLDWTRDVLVALWFACQEPDRSQCCQCCRCRPHGRVWIKALPRPVWHGMMDAESRDVLSPKTQSGAGIPPNPHNQVVF